MLLAGYKRLNVLLVGSLCLVPCCYLTSLSQKCTLKSSMLAPQSAMCSLTPFSLRVTHFSASLQKHIPLINRVISNRKSENENKKEKRQRFHIISSWGPIWRRCSHPGGLGVSFLRDAARTGRVPQHLLVHGLFRSPLVRVLLHQLGQLGVDGLYETNKTKGERERVFGWPRSSRGRQRHAAPAVMHWAQLYKPQMNHEGQGSNKNTSTVVRIDVLLGRPPILLHFNLHISCLKLNK